MKITATNKFQHVLSLKILRVKAQQGSAEIKWQSTLPVDVSSKMLVQKAAAHYIVCVYINAPNLAESHVHLQLEL